MSIIGSLVGYENNNEINKKSQHCQQQQQQQQPQQQHLQQPLTVITALNRSTMLNTSVSSMGKPCPSLNSSISNSVITTASSNINHHHQHHQHNHNHHNHHHHHHNQQQHQNQNQNQPQQQQQQLNNNININNNTKYQNSKRKNLKNQYNHQQYQQSHLHLNSLWSIWYGVLVTLFQGYLAIHGAYRFLGCSLIQWKIEPVAELNLQIVLCGVVFILLPLFFASAVFKVGNLANDGVKLATMPMRRCSLSPHDGLEEEAKGGTLRALWTHGGPTAAFIHILIALCLLLPRLLLEARIIENGLLPKENIWRTELDFIAMNRDRVVVLSFMKSPYQNVSNDYNDSDELGFLDEHYNSVGNISEKFNDVNRINNSKTTPNFGGFPDLSEQHSNEVEDDDDSNDNDDIIPKSYEDFEIIPTAPLSIFTKSLPVSTSTIPSSTTTKSTTTTAAAFTTTTTAKSMLTSTLASTPLRISTSARIRKNYGRRKSHKSRNNEERRTKSEEIDRDLELKSDRVDFSRLNDFEMSTVFESIPNTKAKHKISGSFEHNESPRKTTQHGQSKMTTKDSNIHIVKPEKLPSDIVTSALDTDTDNSKMVEIKSKKVKRMTDDELQVEIEPEYLISTVNTTSSPLPGIVRLAGFSGMLQTFFGVEKEIDVNSFNNPPSMEFINLILGLIVWSIRYPAVFWTTTKPFAAIFSIQMISSALDIIFGFTGVSNLYKLQIVSEALPIQNPGLILNATVTLALYLLSTILLIASSLILYLYGHGRLAAKMRDRSMITLKTTETWIYFAHCASLCFVLALSVVKAPLLNDLSATYRNNLNCPTFISALISVVQLFLWIVIWLGLTAKRRWTFKLPPMQQYGVTKGATQPLLISTRGHNSSVDSNSGSGGNQNIKGGNGGAISTTSSTDGVEDIYWPKLTPSSPKLKVTFNEVTSTSDDVLLISEQDGKRNTTRGTTLCLTGITGETDDGDYATLRSGSGGGLTCGNIKNNNTTNMGNNLLHLSEYDELPPPPALLLKPPSNNGSTGDLLDDNTSEEGKLLACVRDDSVTYASTRVLEPPHTPLIQPPVNMRSPLAQPENCQLPPSPTESGSLMHQIQHHLSHQLVSPLAPVTVTVHTNEAHISSSSTPRCLRRADSGVPNEALTPRSDTTSTTESTTSPPERAPSESSSGVHSGEEREEVVIRPRAVCKPAAKLPPPAIEEEPYGRSTNMRMSSFNNNDPNGKFSSTQSINPLMSNSMNLNSNNSSATLPLTRTVPASEHRIDYNTHCSTMPLPMGSHQSSNITSSHYNNKSQVYSPHSAALTKHLQHQLMQQQLQQQHTTLPNGVRYSNPHFLKRLPHVTKAESPYGHLGYGSGHHTFSKLLQDPLQNLANSVIPEDRDSANYSMSSDQDCMYMNTQHQQQQQHQHQQQQQQQQQLQQQLQHQHHVN